MSLVVAGFCLFNVAILDALFSRDRESRTRLPLYWIPVGLLLGYAGFNIVFTSALIGSGLRALQSASSSMEPLLLKGDRLIIDKRYYAARPKARGDVVIVRRQGSLTVRRIIAVAGDTIQGQQRTVLLNGAVLDEPYIQHKYPLGNDPAMDSFGPVTIPAGRYFVMGDNRDISLDSRIHKVGLMSDDMIVGRGLYFYKVGFGKGPLTRMLN